MRSLSLIFFLLYSAGVFASNDPKPIFEMAAKRKHGGHEITLIFQRGNELKCRTEHGNTGWAPASDFSLEDFDAVKGEFRAAKGIACPEGRIVVLDRRGQGRTPSSACVGNEKIQSFLAGAAKFCRR